ncbi:ATP-binding protein [Candidatus Omnitrophota bacterium]
MEDFDWTAQITVERRVLDTVFSLDFINRHEHVLLSGPVGVGKSFLTQALGYADVRTGHSVSFTRADAFFRTLAQSRIDHTMEKTFRAFLTHELLIVDDFGLQKLTAQQSSDLYELIIASHRQFQLRYNQQPDGRGVAGTV